MKVIFRHKEVFHFTENSDYVTSFKKHGRQKTSPIDTCLCAARDDKKGQTMHRKCNYHCASRTNEMFLFFCVRYI